MGWYTKAKRLFEEIIFELIRETNKNTICREHHQGVASLDGLEMRLEFTTTETFTGYEPPPDFKEGWRILK